MGFAAPLALLALALLVVPLAIHLRPRRSRPPLRVGSVRHLAGAVPPRRAGVRVTERALLAARLAIVAVLVLALAAPFVPGGRPEAPARVALVVQPFAAASPGTPARRLTDSLVSAGFAVRAVGRSADVWREIRNADAALPPGSEIALVAPERVRVSGARPAISAAVSVFLFPHVSDSASTRRVGPAPRSRTVAIVAAPGRRADARYVAAAFRAIAEVRGDTLSLAVDTSGTPAGRGAGEWVVALPDSTALAPGRDALGRGTVLLTDGGAPGGAPFALGYAAGVLTYTLRGRFSADSAGLVLTGALPDLIATIWPDPLAAIVPDSAPARIAASQLVPDPAPAGRPAGARAPLATPLVAAAALLFLAERWMAHRRRPVPV